MNKIALLLLILSISLISGCFPSQTISIVLEEDHNWEVASGRRMWHTLCYSINDQVETLHLSVGVREVSLLLPLTSTHIFALYPLGNLSPLGGGITPMDETKRVTLSSDEGALTDTLLRLFPTWSSVVNNLNYHKIVQDIAIHPLSNQIDYISTVANLVEGDYDEDSLQILNKYSATLDILPSGRYISDSPSIASFYKSEYRPVELENLVPGIYFFLNLEAMMVLTLIIADDEQRPATYYMKSVDTLFTISNSEYQKLLGG